VACGAVAAADGVLGVRLQPELRVERGYPEGFAERLAGGFRHPTHHVFGQPPEDRLSALQKGDQSPPFPLVVLQQFAELFL